MTYPSVETDGIRHNRSREVVPFSTRDFVTVAEMVKMESGIVLEREKMPLVYARLVGRIRLLGLESFGQYCDLVRMADGADERRKMIEALTTNVTRFFREPHHFEILKSEVLPKITARARDGERIRFWSAGCSSGEEPYSIALTLLSLMPDAGKYDIRILATDINQGVLRRGREGSYEQSALTLVGNKLRERWFEPFETAEGKRIFRACPELRGLVTFRVANLINPWPMKGPFQVVFCRNTVIYFDEATRAEIWAKMAELIAPGGYLFVGHSERVPANLSCFYAAGLTTFRRADSIATSAPTSSLKEKV